MILIEKRKQMLNNKTVSVVIPSYNEEKQIAKVISTIPSFVDMIIIVNDKSQDNMSEVVKEKMPLDKYKRTKLFKRREDKLSDDPLHTATNIEIEMRLEDDEKFTPHKIIDNGESKIILIEHLENGGVGAAIATGYKFARDHHIDCTAVMAGDGQMDPGELESICMPVIREEVDYVKGNRLRHKSAKRFIPKIRYYGNSILSILTKIASGYWRVSDTQTGYTSISLEALENIELHKIYKRYGMPNDLLVKLNIASFKISEVIIKPIYHVGEESKMKVSKVIPQVSWLLVKLFFERMFKKYLLKDFHPLFLLYFMSFLTFFINIPITIRFFIEYFSSGEVMYGHLIVMSALGFISFQSFIFAMWFDMQDNDRLYQEN